MPERIVQRARSFSPNLYFTVPFETKKKLEVKRGDKIRCRLNRVVDSKGNIIETVNKEIVCDVAERDGRFYVPPKLIQELNLIGTEYYEFTLQKLVKPDGKEVEIYPNELIEKYVREIKEAK
jgi:hypothetical protein